MSIWQRLDALAQQAPDVTNAELARLALEEMQVRPAAALEELVPLVAQAVASRRRKETHAVERRVQSRRRELGTVLSPISEWRELAGYGFRVGGHWAWWLEATVPEFREKIYEIKVNMAGEQATIDLMEEAISDILGAGVTNLGEAIRSAA